MRRRKETVNVAGNDGASAQSCPVVNAPSTTPTTPTIAAAYTVAIRFTAVESRETKYNVVFGILIGPERFILVARMTEGDM